MKVGLLFSLHANPSLGERTREIYANVRHYAVLAESLGFDGIFFSEHHLNERADCPSPLLAAACAAAVTERLKIGTAVLILPFYHPIKLAEDVAVLDNLSGGRVILGLGLGYRSDEFAGFGIPMKQRRARFDEALNVMISAWTRERFTNEGRYFPVKDISLHPKPVQLPFPPTWLAATSRAGLKRAASRGLSWLPSPAPMELVARGYAIYKKASESEGGDVVNIEQPLLRDAFVAASDEEAWRLSAPYILNLYRDDYARFGGVWYKHLVTGTWQRALPDDSIFAVDDGRRLIDDRFLLGSPDTCVREVSRYRTILPLDYLLIRLSFPGMPKDLCDAAMTTFAHEVLPRVTEPSKGSDI